MTSVLSVLFDSFIERTYSSIRYKINNKKVK